MKTHEKHGLMYAVAIIMGTIIGAGILGLPYAVSVAGVIPGLILMGIVASCMTLLMLYLAETALRCHRIYQLPGLVAKYMGKKYKIIAMILFVIGIYGALISYIIGVSETLAHLTGGSAYFYKFLFTGLVSLPILYGLKTVQRFQFVLTIMLGALIAFICLMISPKIDVNNLLFADYKSFFYPFGIIFFALTGYSVMPELEQIMTKSRVKIDDAIIIAVLLSTVLYSFFIISFVGVYGNNVSQVATESLSNTLGLFGNGIAIFGMTTSFLGLGLAVRDAFVRDLRLNKVLGWALAIGIPFAVSMTPNLEFIQPILITGAYTGTLTGFLIIMTIHKARKTRGDKPAFVTPFGTVGMILVSIMLFLGLISTTLELIGVI